MISNQLFANAYTDGYQATVRFLKCKGAKTDEAEEVAQAAWARGWEAKGQLQQEDRVLPWVNTIAFRTFCTERHRSRRRVELDEVSDTCRGMAACIARIDLQHLILKCSSLDRSLLVHRFYGFTNEEIAKQHGLTKIATRIRIHRSRKALREYTASAQASFGQSTLR